jgi:DNA-binding CsgD family transcriptional regulator
MAVLAQDLRATLVDSGRLTPREGQVLCRLCEGHGAKGIAQVVGCSPKTAAIHLENIARKLGTRGMLHTALTAVAQGMVQVTRRGLSALFACIVGYQMVAGDTDGLRPRHTRQRAPLVRVSHVNVRGSGRVA